MLRDIKFNDTEQPEKEPDEYKVEYIEDTKQELLLVPQSYSKYVFPSNRYTNRLGAA